MSAGVEENGEAGLIARAKRVLPAGSFGNVPGDIVIRVVAAGRPLSTNVSDAMSRDLVACRPEDDLDRAVELMSRHQKSRIVCVDNDDRLVGIISLSDVAQNAEDVGARALRDITELERVRFVRKGGQIVRNELGH